MITTNDLENLEPGEIRYFKYEKLAAELGPMEKYKKYDSMECEEVTVLEYDDEEKPIVTYGWQIIGTNRVVEYAWTTSSK